VTRLAWGSASDVGRVRKANEDMFFTSEWLFAVADGMGGHRGGEVASDLAIASLREEFVVPSTDALVVAVQLANDKVVGTAMGDPELEGMGTTLCAMAVVQVDGADRLAIVNVGDSRVYLLKGDVIEQVTDDHSLVATLERQGRLTAAEAAVHPQRNILTRALGIDARVMVDSWEVLPVAGDRYVLCSDGLFNEVEDSRIASTLRRLADPTDAARELVRLANEGGGHDNITVVIVDVLDDDGVALPEGDQADRVVAAVSGEARAVGHDGPTAPAKPAGREGRGGRSKDKDKDKAKAKAAEPGPRPPARPRTLTWRVLLFIVAVFGVLGLAAGAVTYYGRHTYFVGFENDAVVIYRGRPGGVLWIQPELVERTALTRATVPAATINELQSGKIEPTLADAHRYIVNLDDQIATSGGTPPTTATSTPPVPAGN